MKITNKQVVEFINGVGDGLTKKRLPVKVAYAISRNLNKMSGIVKSYEESREDIIKQYAKKNADGEAEIVNGEYTIPDDQKAAFADALKELLEIENEIDLHKVNFDELEKCDSDKYDSLSAADLMTLDIMTN